MPLDEGVLRFLELMVVLKIFCSARSMIKMSGNVMFLFIFIFCKYYFELTMSKYNTIHKYFHPSHVYLRYP